MSMGNLIRWGTVRSSVMAAPNPSPRESPSADEPSESGLGVAHPTVVPTNFDRDDSSDRDE